MPRVTLRYYLESRAYLLIGILSALVVITAIAAFHGAIHMAPGTIAYIPTSAFFVVCVTLIVDFTRWRNQWIRAQRIFRDIVQGDANAREAIARFSGDQALVLQTGIYGVDIIGRSLDEERDARKIDVDFYSQWIHELKTPVSVIRLVLQQDLGSERNRNRLARETARIESNLEKALYYLRSSSIERDYQITEVDLEAIVRERIRDLQEAFDRRNVTVDLTGPWYPVDTDAKWMSFIVGQLLENAAQYTETEGTVTVTMERNHHEASLTVSDTGPGISEIDAPRIFDRGYTGETGRRNRHSSGLGLYLAGMLCRRLGHRLELLPGSRREARFRISFPRWTEHFIS